MGAQRCPTGGQETISGNLISGMERDGPAVASGGMTQRSGYAKGGMTGYL